MDIFFVLSAFLITLTLKDNINDNHHIPLLTFWKRRLLRLYPALITVVIFYLTIALFLNSQMQPLLKDSLLTILYVSNFSKLYDYVYPHFFGHTWSLSIEEHFYLVWPLLLIGLLKSHFLRKIRIPLLTCLIVLSVLWHWYLIESNEPWSRLYYGSDTRIDAFIVGGLLA